jgi:hypothetical protein
LSGRSVPRLTAASRKHVADDLSRGLESRG